MAKMADIGFNLAGGKLWGSLNGFPFSTHAHSGGFGGSTKGRAIGSIVNNAFLTGLKSSGHDVGGAIPLGAYILLPDKKSRSGFTQIYPSGGKAPLNRTDLLIHGPGPIGSVGCIVVESKDWAVWFQNSVALHRVRFGVAPSLAVIAEGLEVDQMLTPKQLSSIA